MEKLWLSALTSLGHDYLRAIYFCIIFLVMLIYLIIWYSNNNDMGNCYHHFLENMIVCHFWSLTPPPSVLLPVDVTFPTYFGYKKISSNLGSFLPVFSRVRIQLRLKLGLNSVLFGIYTAWIAHQCESS